MVFVLRTLRDLGYSWEEAINQIADRVCHTPDAVKVAVRNYERDRPFKVKKREGSPNTTGKSTGPWTFSIASHKPSRGPGVPYARRSQNPRVQR